MSQEDEDKPRTGLQAALVVVGLAVVGGFMSTVHFDPDLSKLDKAMVSGPSDGAYSARVAEWSGIVAEGRGELTNVATDGAVDNARSLVARAASCDVAYGLIQEGIDWGGEGELYLVGRLPKPESMIWLAPPDRAPTTFAELQGARIGVGGAGSGTAQVVGQLFATPGLDALGVRLEYGALAEQLSQVERGDLDVVVRVIDDGAHVIDQAVRRRGLVPLGFEHLEALARRLEYARVGRLVAGQYDPVVPLPATDIPVLQVDTLVVTNGCAERSDTVAMVRMLSDAVPEFLRRNQTAANTSGLPLDATAAAFYDEGGAGFLDLYFPWAVDIMPVGNWVYVGMLVSVLFNLMGLLHRRQLYQIDSSRHAIQRRLRGADEADRGVALTELKALLMQVRRQAQNMLVPMGSEMSYRYQEKLIEDLVGSASATDDG